MFAKASEYFLKTSWVPGDPLKYFWSCTSFKIIAKASKYFSKTPGMPGGPKYCSEVVEAPECLQKLLNIFKDSWSA